MKMATSHKDSSFSVSQYYRKQTHKRESKFATSSQSIVLQNTWHGKSWRKGGTNSDRKDFVKWDCYLRVVNLMRLIIYLLNKFIIYFIICLLVLQPESKPFGVNRRKFPLVSYSDHCGDSAFTGNNSRVSIHFRRARSAWFVSWE